VTTHRFTPTQYHITIGSHEPVLHLAPGDTVITTTVDAGGHDARNEPVTPGGNPQTGPFFVEGAEPDDTLVVRLDHLTPTRDTGFSHTTIAPRIVDPEVVHGLPEEADAVWRIDAAQGTTTLLAPESALGRLTLPLAPMLGCFGVAPPRGQAISTATSGRYGGNMDYRGFTAGVTVYLPVFVPGALFHLGDGHALQGDGEIVGTGIETSFEVEFTVDLRKGKRIKWPRGENAEYIFTVGNARPLDEAVQYATTEMGTWLLEDYGLDVRGASILMGMCVEYDVGNVYDPAYTICAKLPKRLLRATETALAR
jgi:acetamidase/formamidase